MLKNIISILPFPILGPCSILNTIGKIAKWIYNKFIKYDSKTATINDTKNINELLEKCIDHYKPEAKKFDEIFINYASRQIIEIIKVLREINQNSKIINESVFFQLEYEKNQILKNLEYVHSKKIDDIFSLNNNELLDVLKLEDEKSREKGLEKLFLKGLEKANIDSINELEEILKYQENLIFKEIENNNNLLEEQFKGELREVQEIQNTLNKSKEEISIKKSSYNLILIKLEKLKIK
ncbi:MAG: hypothetical protein ACRC0F_10140 [Cetobacterium sp.]